MTGASQGRFRFGGTAPGACPRLHPPPNTPARSLERVSKGAFTTLSTAKTDLSDSTARTRRRLGLVAADGVPKGRPPGVLRRSGACFEFRHLRLQSHLAGGGAGVRSQGGPVDGAWEQAPPRGVRGRGSGQ
ncbi:hypothetical protein GCM10017776_44680 [Streptomyces griseoluteus]|nr:hypothetical protein GCM10017776_44680 [Streptomyces griseoluteus]